MFYMYHLTPETLRFHPIPPFLFLFYSPFNYILFGSKFLKIIASSNCILIIMISNYFFTRANVYWWQCANKSSVCPGGCQGWVSGRLPRHQSQVRHQMLYKGLFMNLSIHQFYHLKIFLKSRIFSIFSVNRAGVRFKRIVECPRCFGLKHQISSRFFYSL